MKMICDMHDEASKIDDLESEVRQLENTVAYLEKRLGNYE